MRYLRPYVAGLLSYLPFGDAVRLRGTGGTVSPRYCYAVWLRHLIRLHHAGMPAVPAAIAELGPGDSLGIGLAALLSGAESYTALDAVAYTTSRAQVDVLDALVQLFSARTPIPGDEEFPGLRPAIPDRSFPSSLLTDAALATALAPQRIAALRADLTRPAAERIFVRYQAPWSAREQIKPHTIDLVYSQAVLEHVDDVTGTYGAMRAWLKPEGWLSHQVDFRSHGLTRTWDGHWGLSDRAFRLMRGRRPYLLNRSAASEHRAELEALGVDLRVFEPEFMPPTGVAASAPARFRAREADDWRTCGLYIAGRMRGGDG